MATALPLRGYRPAFLTQVGSEPELNCPMINALRFFSLVALTLALPLCAQSTGTPTASISGRVFDPASGSYLGNARVTVAGTTVEAFTDDSGYYRLDRVPAGPVQLRVFYTGLAPVVRSVSVAAGGSAKENFTLVAATDKLGARDAPVTMKEVVVATTKEMDGAAIAINEQRVARNMITVVSADEFGSVAEGNVAEFLKFIPGIAIDYAGGDARNISLNGVPNNYVPVTLGGFDLANAPTSGNNRNVDFNGVSINNIARVEVTQSNTPETPGAALAGSINMVPRSAFERAKPLFTLNVYALLRDNDRGLSQAPGPDEAYNYHVFPGFDFSSIVPVNARFGFTLSGGITRQVAPQDLLQNTWTGVSGASNANLPAPSLNSPYLTTYQLGDRPRITGRSSAAVTFDYKLGQNDRLSLSFAWAQFGTTSYNRAIRFFVNRVAAGNYGPTFTRGFAGAGEIQIASNAREHSGSTVSPSLTYRHNGPVWKAEAGAGYSYATLKYNDLSEGFLRGDLTARRTGVTVSFDDVTFFGPGRIIVTDGTTGEPVDPYSLNSYAFAGGPISDYRDIFDLKRSAYANLRRDLTAGAIPVTLKVGLDVRQSVRDVTGGTIGSSYVGPDGRASTTPTGTSDDNAGFLVDPVFSQRIPPFGLPQLQWLSNKKAAQLYRDRPAYFTADPNAVYRSIVNLERRGEEVVWAAFLRADAQFFRQRLKLTGGVRAEQTNIFGEGPLTDPTANFQRDATGNIVPRRDAAGNILRAANGTPLPSLIAPTTDALGVSKLTFLSRAAHAAKEYLRLLPSLNASSNLRENVIVRGAYYQSVGRPPFSQYYNGTTLPDTESIPSATNRISVNHPGIKAWQADTFRFVLEHYFDRVGLVSVGVFRRDFKNFFGSTVLRATPDLLQQLELDPAIYGGYDIATNYNLPSTVRMQGLDFNYKQALTFLPPWARGVQVFANVSIQRATGEAANANFQGYVPQTYNGGLSFTRERFNLRANWNYRGRQRFAAVTGAGIEGGVYTWAAKRLYLDLSGEVRLTRHFSLVASLRNVNDATEDMKVFGPNTPDYATFRQREDFASLWTLGARATF